jgi:hypothetical protein
MKNNDKTTDNTNAVSRRAFIKSGMILTAGLPAIRLYPFSTIDRQAPADDRLYGLFRQPPVTAKPFVRWWWNGDKLSATEILRELDVMNAAGIGGVEINPIAFPGGDDLAIPSLRWLSPEWIEMVKVALNGASERGMICDIIVGSGWPFGAEFLSSEERSQLLTLSSRKVQGPGDILLNVDELLSDAAPKVHSAYEGATGELYDLRLAPVQMEAFAPAVPLAFDRDKRVVSVSVPPGEHILYALVKITGFQAVINGAPGAAGPVLNHYNPEAIRKFLDRMSDTLFPQLTGMKSFRAMFCDSMELEGANWCADFTDEFKRRRGYDVEPYLPFILYKVGHMGHAIEGAEITLLTGEAKDEVDRVRHDFFVTCMDMMRDRFLIPYTAWCNRHGFKSRVQAYGREFHPLEASLHLDIPECETWEWANDGSENRDFAKHPAYTNVNKFVASAARYAGKKVVSCEESTNTSAVFNVTLERLKITGDQSNLSGVNHSILHGFNYSPPEAPFPGWIRYGMFLNERNTWWPFFKLWAAYKARLSAVFQETDAFADIAVMHPLADMWTVHGPQRDPFPGLHYPEYQYRVWEAIHHNGNSCDYTCESIIRQSSVENGFLKYGSRKYHTLILLDVETLAPATADALARFAGRGGKVIFVGKEPHKSPGLKDHARNDRKTAQTVGAMKRANPARVFTVAPPDGDAIAWFAGVQRQCAIKPYMRIDRPNAYVGQTRHRADGKDLFFIGNCSSDERFVMRASFPESKGTPWLWNPETGERFRYPADADGALTVDLPPATSRLIVFDSLSEGAELPPPPPETGGAELHGWTLRMEHINGTVQQRKIDALTDLSTDEATRPFAGSLHYEARLGDAAQYRWLDLGKVYGVSQVTLDGEDLGCRWYGRHLYRLPGDASGKRLDVKITTTTGNFLKSTPENRTGYGWTQQQAWQPTGLLGPVKLL